jgi:DNA-binding response OmpR family regulator
VLLIDLQGLSDPRETLNEVRDAIRPDRVLVLTALGSLTTTEVQALGFSVIERPASIREVVAAAAALRTGSTTGRGRSSVERRRS